MSFGQAAQAGKAARAARADAEKFVTKAREQLSRNAFAALSLPTEQYEMQREELARASGQVSDLMAQAERGAPQAATAAIMAANQGAREIGAQAAQQMYGLESLQAQEQSRLDTLLAALELQMAEGAAKAYRDEMDARNAALTQGFQQAGQALATGLSAVENYDPTKSVVDTTGQGGGGAGPADIFGKVYQSAPVQRVAGQIGSGALTPGDAATYLRSGIASGAIPASSRLATILPPEQMVQRFLPGFTYR